MYVTVNTPHKIVSHKFSTYVYDLPLHKSNEDTRDNTTDLSFHKIRERRQKKTCRSVEQEHKGENIKMGKRK